MIENKQIVITKSTTFDKGRTLVVPFVMPCLRNDRFRPLNISDVVRAITYADTVDLILSEPCLSGSIVKELLWANKYAEINVIASAQSVSDKYSELKFASHKIDKKVDFNYIAIRGKTNVFAFITDCYTATDDFVDNIYFGDAAAERGFDFPNTVKLVIFADERNDKSYADMRALCVKRNIPFVYLIGTNAYTEETAHKFETDEIVLLCSPRVKNGILYITNDGVLFCVNEIGGGNYVSVEIESLDYYFDAVYESCGLPDNIYVKDIPPDAYVCENGKLTRLDIHKTKAIERTVQINSMGDFLEEKFDKSETESYNRYCTEAEKIIYSFTLIPPVFHTDKFSDIYGDAERIYERWQKAMNYPLKGIIAELTAIGLTDSATYGVCADIVKFDKSIGKIIANHSYEDFYAQVKEIGRSIGKALDNFILYCEGLFSAVNAESSGSKFDKFDDEIEGYKRTIEEKRQLIAQGTDVLNSRNRIKGLEKKIAELTELKQRFAADASVRDSKKAEEFGAFCESVLNGTYKEDARNADSIGGVIAATETTRLSKLKSFVISSLRGFYGFLAEAKETVAEWVGLDIPTEYTVYEQDGKRVIAIESEREFYGTEDIRKRYDLHCVARR